jgi:hypothetical protein
LIARLILNINTMASGDSIGIMDKAFFVGKNIILGWINEFFDVSLFCALCCFIVTTHQSGAVRHWGSPLPDYGRNLPRHIQLLKGQVGCQN